MYTIIRRVFPIPLYDFDELHIAGSADIRPGVWSLATFVISTAHESVLIFSSSAIHFVWNRYSTSITFGPLIRLHQTLEDAQEIDLSATSPQYNGNKRDSIAFDLHCPDIFSACVPGHMGSSVVHLACSSNSDKQHADNPFGCMNDDYIPLPYTAHTNSPPPMCTIHAQFCAHVVHLHNRIDSAQTVDACYFVVGVVCYRIGVVVVFSARHPAYSSSVCTLHIYLYEYVLRSFLSHRITQPQRGIYIYIYGWTIFHWAIWAICRCCFSLHPFRTHETKTRNRKKRLRVIVWVLVDVSTFVSATGNRWQSLWPCVLCAECYAVSICFGTFANRVYYTDGCAVRVGGGEWCRCCCCHCLPRTHTAVNATRHITLLDCCCWFFFFVFASLLLFVFVHMLRLCHSNPPDEFGRLCVDCAVLC